MYKKTKIINKELKKKMRDCIVLPYRTKKEKERLHEQIRNEMSTKHNGNMENYSIWVLKNCIMVESESDLVYF